MSPSASTMTPVPFNSPQSPRCALSNLYIDRNQGILLFVTLLCLNAFAFSARSAERFEPILQFGHVGTVTAVAIDKDNALAVTAGRDGTVRVWNTKTYELTAELRVNDAWVCTLSFSDHNAELVAGLTDGSLLFWRPNDIQTTYRTESQHKRIRAIAVSRNGSFAASSSDDWTVDLWDTTRRKRIRTIGPLDGAIIALAVTPDGREVAMLEAASNRVSYWGIQTGTCLRSWPLANPVGFGAFGNAGDCFLMPTGKHPCSVYDSGTGKPRFNFDLDADATSGAPVAYCQSTQAVACASTSGNDVVVSQLNHGIFKRSLLHGHTTPITSIAFDQSGERIITGCADGTAIIWDSSNGNIIRHFERPTSRASSIAVSSGSNQIAVGFLSGTVQIFDLRGGFHASRLHEGNVAVWCEAFDSTGKYLAVGSRNGTVTVYSTGPAGIQKSFVTHNDGVRSVAFDTAGKRILTGGGDGMATIWDFGTYEKLRTLHAIEKPPVLINIDHEVPGNTPTVWRPSKNQDWHWFYGTQPNASVLGVCFSLSGERAALAAGNTQASIWDLRSGNRSVTLGNNLSLGPCSSIAYSHDGKTVAAAWMNGPCGVFDAESGNVLHWLDSWFSEWSRC